MNTHEGKFMVSIGGLIRNTKTNKYLLLKKHSGNFTIVSGRMKQGEEINDALKREILEETGLASIEIIKLLSACHGFRGEEIPENELIVLTYLCETSTDEVVVSEEHQDYTWCTSSQIESLLDPGLFNSIKNGL